MTKLIPFTFEGNAEANVVCKGVFKATEKGYWNAEVEIDPITQQFLKTYCDCWSDIRGKQRDPNFKCKHIKIMEKVVLKFKKEIGI